ncbi:MAG TPA: amidohydrolase family protein [Vicinamibacterales bacterium]|nr:amidohydrolase family protein [Vicinamibacterales bacterium]
MALALLCEVTVAQDLVVTNARIITGTGRTIDRGSIVVANGRIVSVSPGDVPAGAVPRVDARGLTVLPGFIDTHRHVLQSARADTDARLTRYTNENVLGMLETLLDRGFTTIFSTGDPVPQILDLRARLRRDEVRGPRLFSLGKVFTAPNGWPTQVCRGVAGCLATSMVQTTSPQEATARVAELAAAGVDGVKLVYDNVIAPDALIDDRVVAAITAEARRHGLTVYAHVTAMDEPAMRLVDLGVRAFVHPTPLRSTASAGGAARLRELGIPVATTIGMFSADAAAFNGIPHSARNRAISADWGGAVKHLAESGVTVAFGTDSATTDCVGCDSPPAVTLSASQRASAEATIEIRTIASLLSNAAALEALTRNAAVFIGKASELGTLEPGKIADLVIVDGDPLADIGALERVKAVIKEGRVVVDRR